MKSKIIIWWYYHTIFRAIFWNLRFDFFLIGRDFMVFNELSLEFALKRFFLSTQILWLWYCRIMTISDIYFTKQLSLLDSYWFVHFVSPHLNTQYALLTDNLYLLYLSYILYIYCIYFLYYLYFLYILYIYILYTVYIIYTLNWFTVQ